MPLGFDPLCAARAVKQQLTPRNGAGCRELKATQRWDEAGFTLVQRFVLPIDVSVKQIPPLLRALDESMQLQSAMAGMGFLEWHGGQLKLGPLPLVDLGTENRAKTAAHQASSRDINGGLLVRSPGGAELFRARRIEGGVLVEASLEGYKPRLPKRLYLATQAPLHQAVVRRAVEAVSRSYASTP